jgi:hypothetical protein
MLRSALLFASAIAWSAAAVASCGSAFCSVNTNWDLHSAVSEPGARVDLRYEYIDQDQPRHHGKKVDVGEIPRHHDEVYTRNRNWIGTFDYTFNADWGLTVLAPFVDREHKHIHNHMGDQEPETWSFDGLGDVRALGRYRAWNEESRETHSASSAGFLFGVKLPTGSYKKRNSEGEFAERTLQPGTGTTNALLGAYFIQSLPMKDLSWFAQGVGDLPVDSRDGFKPGKRFAADAGLRYDLTGQLGLLLQANVLVRGRDSGVNAEPEDSGGRTLFISPGLNFALNRDVRLYGFLQVPLYQYVHGVQLTANKAFVVGASVKF